MCEEADEYNDVQHTIRVKARKAHKCCACAETIGIGHFYIKTFVAYDGHGETYKHCLRCNAMVEALFKVVEPCTAIDWTLNCGERWEDHFGPVPDGVARLAFLTPEEAQSL